MSHILPRLCFYTFFMPFFSASASYDLQAKELAAVLIQVHVQHNRVRRHHGEGNYHAHSNQKQHWYNHLLGPACQHLGSIRDEQSPHYRPPTPPLRDISAQAEAVCHSRNIKRVHFKMFGLQFPEFSGDPPQNILRIM